MKEKISITISKNMIKQADAIIDGVTIRNRSQAIESLIRKGLSEESIDCGVILAGGSLKELEFNGTYKPLFSIEGAPVIVNAIKSMKDVGVTKIVIAAGHLTDKLFELVGDGSEFGVNITYVKDDESGTAGAVKAASRFIDFNLKKMADFHKNNKEVATIAVSVTPLADSKDALKITGNRITDFRYESGEVRTHHVNAGIYLFEKEILNKIPKKGSLEKEVLPNLAKEGSLAGFVFSGNWRHLD